MPPASQVNKDFLKAILVDKKRLLKKKEVDYVSVPQWEELSVKRLWPDLKNDLGFTPFF